MSRSEVVVAVDIGSSSIRCSGYEKRTYGSLQPISECAYSYCAVNPSSGKIMIERTNDQNLFDIIDSSVDDVMKEILSFYESSNTNFQICAFGFSSFVMNLVAVDDNGTALGSDYTLSYACNTTSVASEVKKIKNEIGPMQCDHIYKMTGAPIHSAYALAQLHHIYKNEINCCMIFKWQTIASICLSRWTNNNGYCPISYSEASWTGLLNYRTCQYEKSVVDLLPELCRRHLPELADYNDNNRRLHSNGIYWNRWPALRNTNFYLGVGDGACANIGSKCTTPERIACTVGTSAAARICLPLPISQRDDETTTDLFVVEPGLFCYRIDKNSILVGGALTDGGSVVEWIQRLLRINTDEDFQQCMEEAGKLYESDVSSAAKKATNSNDFGTATADLKASVTFVPFLSGERSVGFRTGACGTMHGLTRATTSSHLVLACLEGVIARVGAVIKLIQETVERQNLCNDISGNSFRIFCSGRALEVNNLWRQMLADCTNAEVVLDDDTFQGTLRGAAVMALAASTVDPVTDINQISSLLQQNEAMSVSSSTSTVNKPNKTSYSYWQIINTAQSNVIDAVSCLYKD